MQIAFKDYSTELKENHTKLLGIIQANCKLPFFKEVSDKLAEIHIDIRDTFGTYLYKCIYPISYKTVSTEKNLGNYNSKVGQPAVGKWFGAIRHTNISYYGQRIWSDLSVEHINLIHGNKRKIVEDFYNFKKVVENFKDSKRYLIDVASHVQETKKFQMEGYTYYLTVKNQNNITFNSIELNMGLNPLEILFAIHGSDEFKELYTIKPNSDINNAVTVVNKINSIALERIQTQSLSGANKICLDSPEIFLTPEIKSAMLGFIDKAKGLQDQWVELKTKYAYLLLNKGNI